MKGLCLGRFQTEEYDRILCIEEDLESEWGKYVEEQGSDYFGDLGDFRVSRSYDPFSLASSVTEKMYLDSDNLKAVIGRDLRGSMEAFMDSLMSKETDLPVEARVYGQNMGSVPRTEQDRFLADFIYDSFEETTFSEHSVPTNSYTWSQSRQEWETFLDL